MKKNKIIISIAVLLALISAVLYFTNRRGTLKKELKDFAVKDTGSVNKIFLADRQGRKILLERNPDNSWTLNGKYRAKQSSVKTLLYTVYSLEVQSPVAKSAHNNVVKHLSGGGVKIEIYVKDKLEKTYYVGGPTQDQMGTFMLLENSSTPFVMHIPGFNGFLTTRYFTDELDWRDKSIFRYGQNDIQSITLINHRYPSSSFIVEKENNEYVLKDTSGNKLNGDPLRIKSYVVSYKNIHAEDIIKDSPDSVLKEPPVYTIRVKDSRNKTKSIGLYYKPNHSGKLDDKGNPYRYDIERIYAFTDTRDFLMVQVHIFGKLLKNKEELM